MTRVGGLVLVATPIGNLGDLSPRAAAALNEADVVVCEDTRRTGRLLMHAGATGKRMLVANEHTEASCSVEVVKLLRAGATVAVVTDAGTPGISDPGERLVRAAVDDGHAVTVIPGPVAAVAALVVSGLATGRFVVEGFLPRAGRQRRERLAALADEARTIVLYEAPHRLTRTLADLVATCGDERPVAIARELTKLHEEVWRGTLGDALAVNEARPPIGEHVLVLAGRPPAAGATDDEIDTAVANALASGASVRDAANQVAASLGVARRRTYELATRRARAGGRISG